MAILNFILLMSGPDMAALASMEALLIYVMAPMVFVFFIFLLLAPAYKEADDSKNVDSIIQNKLIEPSPNSEEVAA